MTHTPTSPEFERSPEDQAGIEESLESRLKARTLTLRAAHVEDAPEAVELELVEPVGAYRKVFAENEAKWFDCSPSNCLKKLGFAATIRFLILPR